MAQLEPSLQRQSVWPRRHQHASPLLQAGSSRHPFGGNLQMLLPPAATSIDIRFESLLLAQTQQGRNWIAPTCSLRLLVAKAGLSFPDQTFRPRSGFRRRIGLVENPRPVLSMNPLLMGPKQARLHRPVQRPGN